METARLSNTGVDAYMNMSIDDFMCFRQALMAILEREKAAREEQNS